MSIVGKVTEFLIKIAEAVITVKYLKKWEHYLYINYIIYIIFC